MMRSTTVDLLRHGEVAGGLCLGSGCDRPVNEAGWCAMQRWSHASMGWQGIISSPLKRCADFAHELAQQTALPLLIDEDWRELGFGDWEGRSWEALYQEEGEKLMAFWRHPEGHPAPGGEAFVEFENRVRTAFGRARKEAHEAHWLVVTHAGPIRSALREVIDFPLDRYARIDVPLSGLTRFQAWGEEPFQLMFHGRSAGAAE